MDNYDAQEFSDRSRRVWAASAHTLLREAEAAKATALGLWVDGSDAAITHYSLTTTPFPTTHLVLVFVDAAHPQGDSYHPMFVLLADRATGIPSVPPTHILHTVLRAMGVGAPASA